VLARRFVGRGQRIAQRLLDVERAEVDVGHGDR